MVAHSQHHQLCRGGKHYGLIWLHLYRLCIKWKCMWIFKSGLTFKFCILNGVGIFHQPEQNKWLKRQHIFRWIKQTKTCIEVSIESMKASAALIIKQSAYLSFCSMPMMKRASLAITAADCWAPFLVEQNWETTHNQSSKSYLRCKEVKPILIK